MNTTFSGRVLGFAFVVRRPVLSSAGLCWLCHDLLKFESAFARRVRQGFHFAVIKKTAAIEDDLA